MRDNVRTAPNKMKHLSRAMIACGSSGFNACTGGFGGSRAGIRWASSNFRFGSTAVEVLAAGNFRFGSNPAPGAAIAPGAK